MNATSTLRTLLVAALLAGGCASAPRREFVIPPPPDVARIRLLNSFASQHDLDTSFWTKVIDFLVPRGMARALNNPLGIALSPDERHLYVSASSGNRVIAIDRQTWRFKDFGAEEENRLVRPVGVGVDAAGFIYVADRNNSAIFVYDPALKLVRKIGVGRLKLPTSLAVDRKNQIVYVVNDAANQDGTHTVEAFSLKGDHLRTLGGGRGADNEHFNFPSAVAVSPANELFVSDMLNFRVQVYDSEGRFLRSFGQQGAGVPGKFDKVHGIAWDNLGDLFIVDAGQGVQVLNDKLQPLLAFNNGLFQVPTAIVIDSKNHIFVTDYIHRVVELELINTTKADTYMTPAGASGKPADAAPAPATK